MDASAEITFSTDVCGFFAHPTDVINLYAAAGFEPENSGIEMVLMPPQMEILNKLSRGKPQGFNLNGVHGRLGVKEILQPSLTGLIDWAKVMAADLLLAPIDGYHKFLPAIPTGLRIDMIGQLNGRDPYFNVHNDIVANRIEPYLDYANFAKYSHLSIENGGRENDIAQTVALVDTLHQQGATRTTGTFDLVHAVKAEADGFVDMSSINRVWDSVLAQIGDTFRHLHLPIGNFSATGDSLPILDMIEQENQVLVKDLSAIIRERQMPITFENQHNLLFGANVAKERERLKRIREGLLECGFEI